MEAARGTSIDSSDGGSADRRRPVASPGAWAVFAVVAGVLYLADQVSKRAAVEHLSDRSEDVRVLGDLLQLHLTRNPGAAFSLGTQFTVALSCLAIVATVVVLVTSTRAVDRTWAAGLGSLLAGITGNLTDRMLREPAPFRGHVIDFLQLPNWPIFNVADIAINVGAGLILLQVFRGIRLDGTRHDDGNDDDRDDEAPVGAEDEA